MCHSSLGKANSVLYLSGDAQSAGVKGLWSEKFWALKAQRLRAGERVGFDRER